jgi:hypothetical protein
MDAWKRWQDWITLIVGVGLVIAALMFATGGSTEMTVVTALAVVLIAASLVALARPRMMADRYVVGVVGILLVVSPWAFGFADTTGLAWSAWIGGALTVVIEAMAAAPQLRKTGGPQPHA